jgi:hypothetical protein
VRKGLGFRSREAMDDAEGVRLGRGSVQRKKATLMHGPDMSARRGVGQCNSSGECPDGPWSDSGAGLNRFPAASSIFFLFLSLFFFLFSDLIHIFCNFDSNQVNQISKFF